MSCGKDAGCLTIYKTIYPNLKTEISGSISKINGTVNGIIGSLNGLSVPDDYLGSKVKSRLSSITQGLSGDLSSLDGAKGAIEGFIDQKIPEHQKHYNDWVEEQKRLAQEKEKKKNGVIHLVQ